MCELSTIKDVEERLNMLENTLESCVLSIQTSKAILSNIPKAESSETVQAYWKDYQCTACGTYSLVFRGVDGELKTVFAKRCPECGAIMMKARQQDEPN